VDGTNGRVGGGGAGGRGLGDVFLAQGLDGLRTGLAAVPAGRLATR